MDLEDTPVDLDHNYALDDSNKDEVMEQDSGQVALTSSLTTIGELLPPWAKLPPLVLENVYSFLNREDQNRMSIVCRNWSQEYSYPSLWRTFKFVLPETESTEELIPEVKLAQKYGHMFHHVEIACKTVQMDILGLIWGQLKLFLQAVTLQSKLQSISFVNMNNYLRCLDDLIYDDILQCIKSLLLSQTALKSVALQNSEFEKMEAEELVNVLFVKNNSTLKSLKLKGFVEEVPNDEFTDNLLSGSHTCEALMNLREIDIDYSQIFENIVMACFENANSADVRQRKGSLERMNIFCDGSKRVTYKGIPPDAWECLCRLWPSLKIGLSYRVGYQNMHAVDLFVTRHMPLRSFGFIGNGQNAFPNEEEIGSILRHLVSCEVNGCLEELNITWMQSSTNLAGDLISFLQACPRLRFIQLYIQHPVEDLEEVFYFWIENGVMSVEFVQITVANIQTFPELTYYSTLADDFAPVLQVQGLNLILLVDSAEE